MALQWAQGRRQATRSVSTPAAFPVGRRNGVLKVASLRRHGGGRHPLSPEGCACMEGESPPAMLLNEWWMSFAWNADAFERSSRLTAGLKLKSTSVPFANAEGIWRLELKLWAAFKESQDLQAGDPGSAFNVRAVGKRQSYMSTQCQNW